MGEAWSYVKTSGRTAFCNRGSVIPPKIGILAVYADKRSVILWKEGGSGMI
jgi:hypothetical protein